ncbi:hypothetical protein FIU86_00625 [Roseovarius sp. THAF9]|uniref:DUF4112 domain-containing protein n=1 Tax=Roseovarius sp. THAF9 TaxID=2587847 RepID=UPI0012691981|nr:DUF4112 domain-containing protein [Roseovarius sp. THAF9]QFT91330.1 hypothetical protein FIU86_00625 [Roseovarius sp. THAF9]
MTTDSDHTARLARLDRLANTLDSKFHVPVLGIPVGWDSILGLIPGAGDLITLGPGAWIIVEGNRMGARKRVLGRMALNTGFDTVIGGIPLIGDAFDLFFKSHRRNFALLRRELDLASGAEVQTTN